MNDNKTKAINLINAILNKAWNERFEEDCPIWVENIESSTLIVAVPHGIDDAELDIAMINLFEICDDVHNFPLYGKLLLPNRIESVSTAIRTFTREDYKINKEILDKVLNDPIFADIN